MAVIVSASDETYRDKFVYGGLLAPLKYWEKIFAPRWEKDVLSGSPQIDFLHMAEIKRPEWRKVVGMSDDDAERRIDNAVQILCKRKEPTWVGFDFTHEQFNKNVKQLIQLPSGKKTFSAEYFAFYGYVYSVLTHVKQMYPDARKVDFLVERNGEITKNLPYFYEHYEEALAALVGTDCAGMLGELIHGGKDRSPLQAADLVCWYLRRNREQDLKGVDLKRYQALEKKKYAIGSLEDDSFTTLRDRLKASVTHDTQE